MDCCQLTETSHCSMTDNLLQAEKKDWREKGDRVWVVLTWPWVFYSCRVRSFYDCESWMVKTRPLIDNVFNNESEYHLIEQAM